MRRFLTSLSIITFVILTNSCSTEEFDLISDRNTITIYYTTTDKDIVKVDNDNIISNTYTDEIGTIIINGELTYINDSAFKDCKNLKSITIPNNVKEIGNSAFYGCSGLTSIEIPNSVTSIGENAFYGCSRLTEVHIADLAAWCNIDFENYSANPLYYAKNLCLNGEKVNGVIIPDGTSKIGNYAFYGCSGLTSITIPNSVTSIGYNAFYGCSGLTSVTIPNSITSIGSGAFYSCSGLTSIEIPNSVTSIGDEAFNGCTSLKELRFEDGTKTLSLGYNSYSYSNDGKGLFYDCPLETLYLGRDLSYYADRSYGYSPFYYKSSLESVTIGNSVTSIGKYAFAYCKDLADVYCLSTTVPSTTADTFKGSYPLNTLHVPADAVEYYSVKSPWSGFGTIEALIN
ncbi:MAG: leucine-rich repeat domain-containing protein [Bacteroidaceae bacterium]|nr:leucine-rich repeat domain-containing protein [Bacteroidaceae bacterium]